MKKGRRKISGKTDQNSEKREQKKEKGCHFLEKDMISFIVYINRI